MSTETPQPREAFDDDVVLIDDAVETSSEEAQQAPWTPLFRSPAHVGLAAAAVAVAVFTSVHTGAPAGPLGVAAWIALAAPIAVLALIDARVYRLPFVISIPMFLVVTVLSGVASVVNGGITQLGWMGLAAGVPFVISFTAYWFGKMGLGDVPVLAAMGAALSLAGPGAVLGGILYIPAIVGLLIAAVLWARTKLSPVSWPQHGTHNGRVAVPFGVALAFGAIGAMAFYPSFEALLLGL